MSDEQKRKIYELGQEVESLKEAVHHLNEKVDHLLRRCDRRDPPPSPPGDGWAMA